ncbi:MAG: TonB-dependent receptor [Elusimicrobia bacterium]|nr:TonB-dependent receptor [Elusimicrobiota bacterium]
MRALASALLLLLPGPALAETILPPLVISATRWPESAYRTSRTVGSIDRRAIVRGSPRSTAEALREEAGVLVQQTMPANAAVSVRGLIGKDNLVLIDGARLNNAITASVNSLSLIDIETVETIEVLRGPGSVLHGGDALGGVVYVTGRRRKDYSKAASIGGMLAASYRTADDGRVSRLEIEGNRGRFGFLGGAGYKAFGDLHVGGGRFHAIPSSYRGRSGDVALDYHGDRTMWRATYQHSLQIEAPRYEQYAQARRFGGPGAFDEFVFDPQKRDLVMLDAKVEEPVSFVKFFDAKAYWHRQEEGSIQHRPNAATRGVFNDAVAAVGGRLSAVSQPVPVLRMIYGAEGHRDAVRSRRRDTTLATGAVLNNDANANYPDGSKYGTAALFWLGQWTASQQLLLEAGLRGEYAKVDSVLRAGAAPGAFSDNYRSLTGGFGATYQFLPVLSAAASVWQGFRPPNFNESVALKAAPAGTDAPVTGLKPERSLGFETGIRLAHEKVVQRLTLFHMILMDRIERVPGSFNGATVIAGSPVFQRANSGRGYIQGVEWDGRGAIGQSFYVRGSGSWFYGRDTSAGTALTRTPPPMASVGVGNAWAERAAWVETYTRMAAAQRRLSPADLTDPRIDPNGSSAWATWNLRGGLDLWEGGKFQLAVENILNAFYREHASGVDAPGFNVITSLRVSF